MVELIIAGVIFVLLWVGIIYELNNAPQIDEFGNIIKKKDDE